jgi:sugar O-acyltransferase (sialic acid O-acetyltransferase NeuD family)
MTTKDLLLIGAGGHARSCIDVIHRAGEFRVVGIVGDPEEVGTRILGIEVIGTDGDLGTFAQHFHHAFIGIGQIKTPQTRMKLFSVLKSKGFTIPLVISPESYVSPHSKLGEGSIVMHGAIVNAGVSVGVNCIINSRALLEHDSRVADHCHISTGAILNGNTSVGPGSFIGSGTILKEGIHIGSNTLVGMGIVVRKNLANDDFYSGGIQP